MPTDWYEVWRRAMVAALAEIEAYGRDADCEPGEFHRGRRVAYEKVGAILRAYINRVQRQAGDRS